MSWEPVCALEQLTPERGRAALLSDGTQVALFRTREDDLFAVENFDPFSNAYVMSRGLLGDRAGTPTVASPMYKQVFDLTTGECHDAERVRLRTFEVSCRDGVVAVRVPEAVPV